MFQKYKYTLLMLLALGACTNAKEKMGLIKESPDEFAVVKRAPLEMPPNFALKPPKPGATRPQETKTVKQAQNAVYGKSIEKQAPTSAESAFLNEAGANTTDPNIRARVDNESHETNRKNQPVAKRLLNWGGEAEEHIIDPKQEAERLKESAPTQQAIEEEKEAMTESKAPSITQ